MPTDHQAEPGPPPAGDSGPGASSDTAGGNAGENAGPASASGPTEFRNEADAGPSSAQTGAPEWSSPAGDGPEVSDPEVSDPAISELDDAAMNAVQPAPELQIAGLQDQLAAAVRDLQYKEAELQNLRRRHAEERAAALRYRDEDLLRELLPAIEGLQLALQSEVGGSGDSWGAGVKLAVGEMLRRLEQRGVSVINPAVGQPFDPNEHDGLGAEESAGLEPDCIARTIRPGYRLHDRLLQAAQVIVST